ncbi:MAG: class I tRNA ligase family protein, partial [Acidobacteriota bacterium]
EMLDVLGRDESWEDYWKSDDAQRVQCFGFDNGYFHSILFPATWMAYDPDIRLADTFVTNEFFTLDGKKFSTSRGHAVWGQEALDHLPSDVLRYYLCANRPETEQTDFRLPDVQATIERQLENRWQAWLLDLGARVREQADGKAPEAGEPSRYQALFHKDMDRLGPEVTRVFQPETYSPQRAVAVLDELVRAARAFGQAERQSGSTRDTALALELGAAALLAGLVSPIMPNFAARLRDELGFDGEPDGWADRLATLPAGQVIRGLDKPFFPNVAAACEAIAEARATREAAAKG